MNNNIRKIPTVFISSTCYDLKHEREYLKDFFENNYGFETILSEFNSFPIDPSIGPCDNCLNNVDNYADFFILIIGTRYGYITDKGKSITNLEYLHAKAKGIPIFVFIDKQLYTTWNIWKNNKDEDFSTIVDNPKIFDFLSEIYDESQQWVYTYDNKKDITLTIKNQLCLIFSDGLIYRRKASSPEHSVLTGNLPTNAIRMIVEKPFAWEYKFFAYVIKNEFDNLKRTRWDFKYGFFNTIPSSYGPQALLDDIEKKLDEIQHLVNFFNILVNKTLSEAIGAPGVPSDLEMIVYTSKRLASIYEKILQWGLHFKSLRAAPIFDKLLDLLYKLPSSIAEQLDAFIQKIYSSFTCIPSVERKTPIDINISCKLDIANIPEILEEIEYLNVEIPLHFSDNN